MATRASPKAAGRKKVRCPKCTALFTEPNKTVFECPICECRLSANGGSALAERASGEGASGYRPGGLGKDEPNKTQSPIDLVRKEGNGMTQEGMRTGFEQDCAADRSQGYKKGEQQPNREESSQKLDSGTTDGQLTVESSTIEGIHGRTNMLGPFPPLSKAGNSVEKNERGELPPPLPLPPLSVRANKEVSSFETTGQDSLDDGLQDMSLKVRQESTEEGLEREDCLVNSGASTNRHLQAQMFRATRCEFSFKYALAGAPPSQADGELQQKRSPPTTIIVSSEAFLPKANASDVPLPTPLRVRISKAHEESSDPSEHGQESFGSETDSDDASDSDFDFPSPWAKGEQDLVLPGSFKGNEAFHPDSETVVSGTPHQLELQDVDETLDDEEITGLGNYAEKIHDTELSSKIENAGKGVQDEQANLGGYLRVDEKGYQLLDRSEIAISGLKPLTSQNQSIDAGDLASYISSPMHLGAVGNDEGLVTRRLTQKLNGFGLQERSADGEEQEVDFKGNSLQGKLRNTEAFMNVSRPEAAGEPRGVLSNSQQVMNLKGYGNGTQDSIDAGFASSAIFSPKQSSPHINHMDSSDKIHTIPNTEIFQMVRISEKGNYPMTEALSSSMLKEELSNDVAFVRDGQTSAPTCTDTVDTEMEQDLYKLPRGHEIDKKDLYPPESSRSSLWVEAEKASSSAFSDDITSKFKLCDGKKSTQRSVHGKKLHVTVGSPVIQSDDGGDQLIMPSEVRDVRRGMGAGAGASLSASASVQATSAHVEWEGRQVNAVEGQSNHADLYGKPGSYSQLGRFLPGNPHPYAFATYPYEYAASGGTSQVYSYQFSPQSLMLPAAAFSNHALSHCGYHPLTSACMLCSYHQHPHLPSQHIPHCGACCSPGSSLGYNPGALVEHWNCHQADFGSASSRASSLVDSPQAHPSSANQIQSYHFPIAKSRPQASSTKKYPPYPNIGAVPYVTCKGCTCVLQVPSNLPPNDGMMQKLRCGFCGKVTKFSAKGGVSDAFLSGRTSINGVAKMSLQTGAYGSHNKQLPISSATEIVKSSYKHDMIKGNPILHRSKEASPILRSPEQSPRGGEFRQVQPRGQAMDTSTGANWQHDPSISASITGPAYSQNTSGVAGAMSPRNTAMGGTNSIRFERSKGSPAALYHLPVDEKEEGLDFGAPRISDGDSLDHSESRMRSPEYRETQHVAAVGGQFSDSSEDDGAAGVEKQPGSPLLVLLNQASTRFRLNLEPRVTFEGAKPGLWSPVSDSAVYASSLPDHFQNRDQDKDARSHGSPGHHFVSKGPKYIAGLLRRSLRDFSRGSGDGRQ